MRQLLNHRAGLCAVDEPLNPRVLSDLDRVAGILAWQRPAWEPGIRQGYHYLTLGLCENELIRRVDPLGRSLGRFISEEIVAPLGEEFYIGLPPEVPASRVATVEAFHPLQMLLHVNTMPLGLVLEYMNPRSLTARTLGNPKLRSPAISTNPSTGAWSCPPPWGDRDGEGRREGLRCLRRGRQRPRRPSGDDRGTVRSRSSASRRLARRGPQDRHELLARLLQTFACLPLRNKSERFRHTGGRRLVRLRRPRGRGGFRLRTEQDGLPRVGRPSREGAKGSAVRLPRRAMSRGPLRGRSTANFSKGSWAQGHAQDPPLQRPP